jgi:cytochrome P450
MHVGFCHGVRVCPGSMLARLEMRIACGELLREMDMDDAGRFSKMASWISPLSPSLLPA